MNYETHLLDNKKERKWFSRLLKLVFILSACFLVMITVLSNMGGSSEALKGSVEDFVSSASGRRPVRVGVLNHISFFPKVGVDLQNLHILTREEHDYPIVRVGKAQIFMNFWDVVFGGAKIVNLYVEDVYAIKGIIGRNDFSAERIFIDHDIEQGRAYLKGNGKVGVHSWNLSLDLEVYGSKGSYSYSIPKTFSLIVDLADIHIHATFTNHEDAYFKIQNASISVGDNQITLNGVLSAAGRRLLKFRGDISNKAQEKIAFDLLVDTASAPSKISGDITSDNLSFDMFKAQGDLLVITQRLREVFGYDGITASDNRTVPNIFGYHDLDLNVNLNSVLLENNVVRNLEFPIVRERGMLRFGPMKEGDKTRVPLITFVPVDAAGASLFMMQEGALDLGLFFEVFSNRPPKLNKQETIDVSCGLWVLGNVEKDSQPIEFMTISAQDVHIRSTDKAIPKGTALSEIDLSVVYQRPEFPIVSLPKAQYDFMQGSLQNSTDKAACSDYIQPIENIQIPEENIEGRE